MRWWLAVVSAQAFLMVPPSPRRASPHRSSILETPTEFLFGLERKMRGLTSYVIELLRSEEEDHQHQRRNTTEGTFLNEMILTAPFDRSAFERDAKVLEKECDYLDDFATVRDALLVAYAAHARQFRKSGEPYIVHPVEVARLLASLRTDVVTVAAGLLHDTVEDTNVTFQHLDERFGRDIRKIVEGETKVSKLPKIARRLGEQHKAKAPRLFNADRGGAAAPKVDVVLDSKFEALMAANTMTPPRHVVASRRRGTTLFGRTLTTQKTSGVVASSSSSSSSFTEDTAFATGGGGEEVFFVSQEQAENLRQMFVAMTDDYRIIVVKLADRLHNMRTLAAMRPEKQRKIARETLEIFAPLAHRLGLWQFKAELEDIAFRYAHPAEYESLAKALDLRKRRHDAALTDTRRDVERAFREAGVRVAVSAKKKELYSLWLKLRKLAANAHDEERREERQRSVLDSRTTSTLFGAPATKRAADDVDDDKEGGPSSPTTTTTTTKERASSSSYCENGHFDVDAVKDVVALQVVLDVPRERGEPMDRWRERGVRACYDALAVCNYLEGAEPTELRVKDYIRMPKPNGYQSLHVFVRNRVAGGQIVELQIRTRWMDDVAQHGMAAHWPYNKYISGRLLPRHLFERRVDLELDFDSLETQDSLDALDSLETTLDLDAAAAAVRRSAADATTRQGRGDTAAAAAATENPTEEETTENPYAVTWLDSVKTWQHEIPSSREFIDTVRREVLGERVFVFLRDGKILDLSRGATALDAAFHIHTEVGLRAKSASINGREVHFGYELQNGDLVDVRTSPDATPQADWLRWAHRRSTKTKLKAYFKRKALAHALAGDNHPQANDLGLSPGGGSSSKVRKDSENGLHSVAPTNNGHSLPASGERVAAGAVPRAQAQRPS